VKAIWRLINALVTAILQTKQPAPPTSPYNQVLNGISERIVTCATIVSKTLGPGLTEVIYENALAHELRKAGFTVSQQQNVAIYYEGMIVGDYTANLLVEDTVLVELKAINQRNAFDSAQCTNYLKSTGHACSLLLNFGNPNLDVQCVVNSL
jgi:GxxExxY protein